MHGNEFDLKILNAYGKPDQNQGVRKIVPFGLEVRSSIHLSYRRLTIKYTIPNPFRQGHFSSQFFRFGQSGHTLQ